MASNISMTFRSKSHSAISETMHFRRKDKQPKTKKVKRKIKLRARHFLMYFLFVGGLFLGVQKTYLFLISWEKLNVTHIDIQCTREAVRSDIKRFLQGKSLGNLLLCDISTLKENLLSHPWIKDVHMRKSFPSTVEIVIIERNPVALLMSESLYLIDKEGVKLQKVDPEQPGQYPLLVDDKAFVHDIQTKLDLAWDFLDSLTQNNETEIAVIDLSEYNNVKVKMKDSPTWLILGYDHFTEKIDFFMTHQDILYPYGSLEYVDLRFNNRLYIKPHDHWARTNPISLSKEAD